MKISVGLALAALAAGATAECMARETSARIGEPTSSAHAAPPRIARTVPPRTSMGRRRIAAKATTVITTLPFDIVAPGTYVLDRDLVATSGDYAIWIKSSGVTLDCQDHSISTQSVPAAISGNEASGQGYTDVTIQNCVVSGFKYGISTGNSGSRHQVLNNTVRESSFRAIAVWGDDMLVKDNRVWKMRSAAGSAVIGIQVAYGYFGNTHKAQIIGNTIADLAGEYGAMGISVLANDDVTISQNAIMDIRTTVEGISYGIEPNDYYGFDIAMVVENNVLVDRVQDLQANEPRPFGSLLPFGPPVASLCAHNVFIGYLWIDTAMCEVVVGGSEIP